MNRTFWDWLPAFRWGETVQEVQTPPVNWTSPVSVVTQAIVSFFSWIGGFVWGLILWMAKTSFDLNLARNMSARIDDTVAQTGTLLIGSVLAGAILVFGAIVTILRLAGKQPRNEILKRAAIMLLCAGILGMYAAAATRESDLAEQEGPATYQEQISEWRNQIRSEPEKYAAVKGSGRGYSLSGSSLHNIYTTSCVKKSEAASFRRLGKYGRTATGGEIYLCHKDYVAENVWTQSLGSAKVVFSPSWWIEKMSGFANSIGSAVSEFQNLAPEDFVYSGDSRILGSDPSPFDCAYYIDELNRRAEAWALEENGLNYGTRELARAFSDIWTITSYQPAAYAQWGDSAYAPAVYCRTLEALSGQSAIEQFNITADAAAGPGDGCDMVINKSPSGSDPNGEDNPNQWRFEWASQNPSVTRLTSIAGPTITIQPDGGWNQYLADPNTPNDSNVKSLSGCVAASPFLGENVTKILGVPVSSQALEYTGKYQTISQSIAEHVALCIANGGKMDVYYDNNVHHEFLKGEDKDPVPPHNSSGYTNLELDGEYNFEIVTHYEIDVNENGEEEDEPDKIVGTDSASTSHKITISGHDLIILAVAQNDADNSYSDYLSRLGKTGGQNIDHFDKNTHLGGSLSKNENLLNRVFDETSGTELESVVIQMDDACIKIAAFQEILGRAKNSNAPKDKDWRDAAEFICLGDPVPDDAATTRDGNRSGFTKGKRSKQYIYCILEILDMMAPQAIPSSLYQEAFNTANSGLILLTGGNRIRITNFLVEIMRSEMDRLCDRDDHPKALDGNSVYQNALCKDGDGNANDGVDIGVYSNEPDQGYQNYIRSDFWEGEKTSLPTSVATTVKGILRSVTNAAITYSPTPLGGIVKYLEWQTRRDVSDAITTAILGSNNFGRIPDLVITVSGDDNGDWVEVIPATYLAAYYAGILPAPDEYANQSEQVINFLRIKHEESGIPYRKYMDSAAASRVRALFDDAELFSSLVPNSRGIAEISADRSDALPADFRLSERLDRTYRGSNANTTPPLPNFYPASTLQLFSRPVNYYHAVRLANFWTLCIPQVANLPTSYIEGSTKDLSLSYWKLREPFADKRITHVDNVNEDGSELVNSSFSQAFEIPQYHVCAAVWSGAAQLEGISSRVAKCDNGFWDIGGFVCTNLRRLLNFFGLGARKAVAGDITNVLPYGGGVFEVTSEQYQEPVQTSATPGQIAGLSEDERTASDWLDNANNRNGPGPRAATAALIGLMTTLSLAVLTFALLVLVLGSQLVIVLGFAFLPLALLAGMWPSEKTQKGLGKYLKYMLFAVFGKTMATFLLAILTTLLWVVTTTAQTLLGSTGLFALLTSVFVSIIVFLFAKKVIQKVRSVASDENSAGGAVRRVLGTGEHRGKGLRGAGSKLFARQMQAGAGAKAKAIGRGSAPGGAAVSGRKAVAKGAKDPQSKPPVQDKKQQKKEKPAESSGGKPANTAGKSAAKKIAKKAI